MSPVRVLYTIPELCIGGAERQLLALAKGLDRRRFEPAIAVLRRGGALEGEAAAADVRLVEATRRGRFDPRPALRLARYIRAEGVTVVHAFLFLDGLYARLAGALGKAPVRVASLRGADYAAGSWKALADRALAPLASCLVANSAWMRGAARRNGLERARIEVIPNGVDAGRFAPGADRAVPTGRQAAARRGLGLREDGFVVGMVARLSAEKDHETFLRGAAEVAARCADAAFLVVGDGPERERVERRVRGLGLEGRVALTGWRADMPGVMAALDVLALTSRSESSPNAILEAMAAGLPVVATRVGGVGEMVAEGETALLAPAGDARGLAAHLLRLRGDGALRARLGSAGRERAVRLFSLEAMVRRYEALYTDLLGGGGPACLPPQRGRQAARTSEGGGS